MNLLYNLFIGGYYLIILFASAFNKKAHLWISGRQNLLKNIQLKVNPSDNPIWFHCASLGEFEQGRPVIERIKKLNPQQKILVTFFSPSGYEIRKNYAQANYIFYLPLDTPRNAKKLVKIINPRSVYFVKYEFWKNLLYTLKKNNTPVYLMSAHFRPQQIFFKSYGGWYKRILTYFTQIFVQNDSSKSLLENAGIPNVVVASDTRFDRVAEIAKSSEPLPLLEKFKGDSLILLGGSTWPDDEKLLIKYIQETNIRNIKLVLAPHETHSEHIKEIIDNLKTEYILYTEENSEEEIKQAKVLIINTIGILSSAYKYADAAFIGGGFGVGIHNTLEAATFEIPVTFGPNYKKFNEAVELINMNAAFSIKEYNELKELYNNIFNNTDFRLQAGNNAGRYVKEKTGATEIILQSTLNFQN